MLNTLSICILTKNEEKNIERCIKSISKIADEIVVVDTGSSDSTISLAENLGSKVYSFDWCNDFSIARNFALTHCTKEWIFMLDADEILDTTQGNLLKDFLSTTKSKALYLNLINVIGFDEININPSLRIFKNNNEYKYTSKLHEQIYDSIKRISGDNVFEYTNFIVRHYGYDHNVIDMKKKSLRNIEILNSYSDEDKDGYYYFNLGNEYSKLSQLEKANKYFVKSFEFQDLNNGIKPYLAVNLIKTCYQLNHFNSALNYLTIFLKEFPDFKDLYFLESSCYNEMMKYYESYIALNIYKSLIPNLSKYPSFNFDKTNDIDKLTQSLFSLSIPHSINLLTTLILINKFNEITPNVIKSVYEISDEIIIINLTDDESLNLIFEELGCIVYNSDMTKLNLTYNEIEQFSTGTWTLYLNENKLLTHADRTDIINTIRYCEKNDLKESFDNYVLLKK